MGKSKRKGVGKYTIRARNNAIYERRNMHSKHMILLCY